MVIGIDATRANKPQKTGVEWYCYHIIREMIHLDQSTTFRLYFNTPPEPGLQNLGSNVEYRQLRWPFRYLWTQIRLSLEMLFNPPDVLFIPGSIIPVITPPKTVTNLHDVAYEVFTEDLSWKSRAYLRFAAKLAKKRCPKIVTVSQFSKDEIIKYYNYKPENIIVTPLAVMLPETLPEPYVSEHPYIMYVGRLESKKNIAQLIRVFTALHQTDWGKDYQLHLAGYPSRGWEEAEQLIHHNGLNNAVVIHGWVDETTKYALLQGAAAYVHLAKYEGFNINILEAMACQTPVVVNNAGSSPEIAGGAAQLTNASDIPATVEHIYNVIHNQDLHDKLIADGLKRYKEFDWATCAKKTLEVLKNV